MPTHKAPARPSRLRSVWGAAASIAVLLMQGCGSGETPKSAVVIDDALVSISSLGSSSPVDVNDSHELVESAVYYGIVSPPEDVAVRLSEEDVVVMPHPDSGFDSLVLYRSGPHCGEDPRLSTERSSEGGLSVRIAPITSGEVCDDMEYDAAVGVSFRLGHSYRDVAVELAP